MKFKPGQTVYRVISSALISNAHKPSTLQSAIVVGPSEWDDRDIVIAYDEAHNHRTTISRSAVHSTPTTAWKAHKRAYEAKGRAAFANMQNAAAIHEACKVKISMADHELMLLEQQKQPRE